MNYLESGSKARKAILDTNIIYSALYKPEGVCGKILLNAMNAENRLLSIDFAKEELSRNMESKLRLPKKNIDLVIEALPLEWIHRDIYAPYIQRAGEIVRYRSDSPFVAASIATGFPLITGDKHLRTAKVRRVVRVYRPGEFLNASSI